MVGFTLLRNFEREREPLLRLFAARSNTKIFKCVTPIWDSSRRDCAIRICRKTSKKQIRMTSPSALVIWGASGHALVVADIIRLRNHYNIAGFIDSVNPKRSGAEFCGSYIIGGQEQLELLRRQEVDHIILGFGNCRARLQLSELIRAKGFALATAIHPQSVIANDVVIGAGTVIVAGAVINSGVEIGENVIVNTCASVDHECVIEDGAHICPGVRLAGRVTVGRASWIGIGSTIIDRVRIGSNTLIGAGSVVVSDIPDSVVAYGVPARVMRRKTDNE